MTSFLPQQQQIHPTPTSTCIIQQGIPLLVDTTNKNFLGVAQQTLQRNFIKFSHMDLWRGNQVQVENQVQFGNQLDDRYQIIWQAWRQ